MRAPYPWKTTHIAPEAQKTENKKIKNDSRKIGYDPRSIFFWCHEDLLRNLICEIDNKIKKYEKKK